MAADPHSNDQASARSSRTNAIIAALATILAAVIAAAGAIIASGARTNNRLEESSESLNRQLRDKTQEAEALSKTVVELRAEVARLRGQTPSGPSPAAGPNVQ
ncbi:MAG: hypothetical protein ACJ770_05835, partial [Gemmatimonadaceae bacterium]